MEEVKLFGAALDILDDPGQLALKRGWAVALRDGRVSEDEPLDPFDAIAPALLDSCPTSFASAGKIDFPSCLTPRPKPEDINAIESTVLRFYDDVSMSWTMMRQVRRFIEQHVFPSIPGMISVDHSLTMGAYAACCRRHGAANVSLVVLDSHFDAIPTEIRAPAEASGANFPSRDVLHCGNFIERLFGDTSDISSLLNGVDPKNIVVIGPSDYPPDKEDGEDESISRYRDFYMSFIDKGVTVIPKSAVRSETFIEWLRAFVDKIRSPYVYVSLDADIGSVACMNAVRFMDTVGLDAESIVGISSVIRERIDSGGLKLAGFDISEINVHLLGLPGPEGQADRTVEVCSRFLRTLVGCNLC